MDRHTEGTGPTLGSTNAPSSTGKARARSADMVTCEARRDGLPVSGFNACFQLKNI